MIPVLVAEGEKLEHYPNLPKDLADTIIKWYVDTLVYSPSGKIIATGGDKNVRLWDATTLKLLHVFTGHEKSIASLSIDPSWKFIASRSHDGALKFWDVEKLALDSTYEQQTFPIGELAYSPNGKLLAHLTKKNSISLLDIKTKKNIHSIVIDPEDKHSQISSFSLNPDGKHLAASNLKGDITVWDYTNNKTIATFKHAPSNVCNACDKPINSLIHSPNGKFLVSSSKDQTVKLWNLENYQLIHTFSDEDNKILAIAISPDNNTLAIAQSNGKIRLLEIDKKKLIQEITVNKAKHNKKVSIAFSPSGKHIAIAHSGENMKLWSIKEKRFVKKISGHRKSLLTKFSISPDNSLLAYQNRNRTLYIWDMPNRRLISNFKQPPHYHPVGFNKENTILYGHDKRNVYLWDIKNNVLVDKLSHDYDIDWIALSPNRKTVVSGTLKGQLTFWDVDSKTLTKTFEAFKMGRWEGFQNNIQFSPDSKTLAAAHNDTIKIWDAKTYALMNTIIEPKEYIDDLNFSPDGKVLTYFTSSGKIKRVNADTMELISSHNHSKKPISPNSFHGALSPDGENYGYMDFHKRSIEVKNIESGEILASVATVGVIPAAPNFSNDGGTLLFLNMSGERIDILDIKNKTVTDTLLGGAKGNWLWHSISEGKFWRGDDGSLLSLSKTKAVPLIAK